MRTSILIFLSLLLGSCLKDHPVSNKPIIDYKTYGEITNWIEIQRKEGNHDWVTLSDGNPLTLLFKYTDDTKTGKTGEYSYNPIHLGLAIDTTGYVLQKDGLMLFVAVVNGERDTPAVASYKMVGDTLLILKDTTVIPSIEIKYEKADSR